MQEVIDILNMNHVNYAILRNYENLLDDEIYMDGHGDVDLICEDSNQIAKLLNVYFSKTHTIRGEGDRTHYYIYINNIKVSLDLRHIGDDYYCRKWEKDMLDRSILYNGFNVLSPKDHFYTLIYHAIFQKKELSKDYKKRLKKMGISLGINMEVSTTSFFVNLLENYMKLYNYHYCYAVDKYVPLKKKHIQDKSLLVMNYYRFYQHKKFELKISFIEMLVHIYHLTLKRK